ncbi:DNA damage-induced cell division inhibitor SosA [Staphylococcus simiae]|uniref:Uncharacterized protein n=1 Tax=Staphylococcus simiae CCM 7213 = CCUG 51256 TaxID=911238 RepID=G5JLW7_9STAP|nr:DNA damage-induced cell division inhibitor SosA [Staphylococcus simiae]EHJ06826.1 hypothetical protein SS7213T_12432 [Staphylococcus simiae CCM 7213 = CCUG 51256]PNZ09397.1 hypothetical protein CD113_11750 [Staphylococcus simiae]SNV70547.1 putative secreted protein [Staphylococcus simiae]
MFNNINKTILTYISIFLISCAVFTVFIISVNISAHTEQTYEMTDHQLRQNNNNRSYEHTNATNDNEQDSPKVFASIN